jgi:hypothetical protein
MHSTSRSMAWEWSVKLVKVPGASPLDKSYVAMESCRSSESRTCSIDEGQMMEGSINCVARRIVFVLFDMFDDINSP